MKKVIVIGSGFAGLSAACFLAKDGYDVSLLEKNSNPGGRARKFSVDGFTFDMGPSWYWMPDVFEHFFHSFGRKPSDFYELLRLDPSYKVIFGKEPTDHWEIPASYEKFKTLLEKHESNASDNLDRFMKEAAMKYDASMNNLIYRPSKSIAEFIEWRVAAGVLRMKLLKSYTSHVRKYFKNEKIIQLLEFPVLFLGAKPSKIPALYSLMNYADIKLGTWYPLGGMHKIIDGMVSVAKEHGVNMRFNSPVDKINPSGDGSGTVISNGNSHHADIIVAGADYHHVETSLLDPKNRSYSKSYWDKRVLAPSAMIYYLGINRKVNGLQHHNLFFDTDFEHHAAQIYDLNEWPDSPLFYVCAPSITDPSIAPDGKENLFILIPVSPGLKEKENTRQVYLDYVLHRLEEHCGHDIHEQILYSRSYSIKEFEKDYNAFRGNAYGLASTLRQTAWLRPKLKSKKINNLYYTGQFTVPGPGVPPALISGEVVAREVRKDYPIQEP